MGYLLKVLIIIASIVLGGGCIGAAVNCFKKSQYGGFGVGIMISLAFIFALFRACISM